MDSTIISRGGDEMEIEGKERGIVKPEKKAKSCTEKPAKASILDPALDLRAQRPISCCERI